MGSCAAPSVKGDDKFITTDYLQQCPEFTWREPRRVLKSLTVQYDKVLYLIEDSKDSRRAIGKYIDV